VSRPGNRRDRLQPAGRRLSHGQAQGRCAPAPGTRFTLGAAPGLYRDLYWQAAQFEAVASLKAFCAERALNLATASVAWVLAQPGITSAIEGASRPEQLAATLAAADMILDDGGENGTRSYAVG